MVYDLFRALPGDRALLPPSPLRSLLLKNLTPASRRQDHTTSPSASAPFVIGASASTASRLTSVTIAKRPSERGGTGESILLFLPNRQPKFGNSEIFSRTNICADCFWDGKPPLATVLAMAGESYGRLDAPFLNACLSEQFVKVCDFLTVATSLAKRKNSTLFCP
jgi:hypothetical protein